MPHIGMSNRVPGGRASLGPDEIHMPEAMADRLGECVNITGGNQGARPRWHRFRDAGNIGSDHGTSRRQCLE